MIVFQEGGARSMAGMTRLMVQDDYVDEISNIS